MDEDAFVWACYLRAYQRGAPRAPQRAALALVQRVVLADPLPDDVRIVVIQSWKNFEMLPPATVEAMVPKQVDATIGV